MNLGHFKSNSIEGDNFVSGIMNIEKRWYQSRELFTKFINNHGFVAWHIHDGWVMNGYNKGDILHHVDIRIGWVKSHAGYSHTFNCPNIGEKMVIIKDSPDMDKLKPFDLYCYEVVGKKTIFSLDIELKRIDIKQAIFNKEENNYNLYTKKSRGIFSFFKKSIKKL